MTKHFIIEAIPGNRSGDHGGIVRTMIRLISSPRGLAALAGICIVGNVLSLTRSRAADQPAFRIPMAAFKIRTAGIG